MPARYAHLHLHSEYSLVDSTIRIPELVTACAARGLPAVAITDQNNLFALVKFYKEAEKAGIKPIAGADVLLAEGTGTPSRLTLLCRDQAGYLSLSELLTRAWMEGHRVDGVVARPAWLEANAGLFALAGPQSDAGQLLAGGRHDLAEAAVADLQRRFGERLHLELVRTGRQGEDAFNAFALDVAARRGIPVVASNDVRFLDAEGFDAHEARVCIASGRVLDDARRPRDYSAEQFLKPADAMAALFADVPDALDNSLALATRCNLELRLGTYYLPAFPVLQADFHTTAAAIQLTLTGTMIGFALGQLIVGPLSDKVGRRIPLLVVTAVHVVASAGAALAPSLELGRPLHSVRSFCESSVSI